MNAIPNTSFQPGCTLQRQPRSGSVTHQPAASSLEAANDAGPAQSGPTAGPSQVLQFGHAGLERRFEAWLHGSQLFDAPLRARYLDSPEHQAEALAYQRRAVRADSYVPARTPLLFP